MSFLLRGATATGGRNSTAVIREAPAAGTAAIGALGAAINVLDAPPTAVLGAVFGNMPLYTTGAGTRAEHAAKPMASAAKTIKPRPRRRRKPTPFRYDRLP